MTLPYDYYPLVIQVLDLISQGRTKTRACDEANISIPTFDQYVKNVPELRDLFSEAEQRGYDAMAEALVDIDNHAIHGQSDPKMAKVISDNIKWLLSKRRSKEYGERITVDHNITADKAITDALVAGRKRAQLAATLDGDFVDVTPVIDNAVAATADELLLQELLS